MTSFLWTVADGMDRAADDDGNDIVVGIDGSASALAAARWAAVRARAWNAPLRLVHAKAAGTGSAAGSRPLTTAVEAVRALAPEVPIALSAQYNAPQDALIDASIRARLIVVGVRGTSDRVEDGPGAVASAVSHYGGCPVVMVRGRGTAPSRFGPVVIGVDGSPSGTAALRFGFEFARSSGAPIVAAHAWTEVALSHHEWTILPGGPAEIQAAKQRQLATWLAPLRAAYPEIAVTEHVTHDRPVRGLLAITNPPDGPAAQLLIVGSRGLGVSHGMLASSVGQSLLRHADCPVAVVRPHQLDGVQPGRFGTVGAPTDRVH
ncbi:universal stress protein [Haloechinothrix salitolerans]|uniref:Universal stress protein n=1 Tax=Haloechinothrix salitolerans TaxID=926830 RepID=A0ABW2C4V6_9PSEU